MEMILLRKYFGSTYTIGALHIKNQDTGELKYFCDTLEPHVIDWGRERKVWGKTAIPCGRYKVTLRYSSIFKRKMPFLENVPHFTGIMLHTGNSPEDTKGCILVGMATVIGRLSDSRATFKKLYELIEEVIGNGEEVEVVVSS